MLKKCKPEVKCARYTYTTLHNNPTQEHLWTNRHFEHAEFCSHGPESGRDMSYFSTCLVHQQQFQILNNSCSDLPVMLQIVDFCKSIC